MDLLLYVVKQKAFLKKGGISLSGLDFPMSTRIVMSDLLWEIDVLMHFLFFSLRNGKNMLLKVCLHGFVK